MVLPSELVSEFAKITKDTEPKKEAIVYGTIVKQNDKKYVKLDGSDILTPAATTVDMEAGERVMVHVKNHTAIITGNITSPAAAGKSVQDMKIVTDCIANTSDGVLVGDNAKDELAYNILLSLSEILIRKNLINLAKFSDEIIEIGNSDENVNIYGKSIYQYINGFPHKSYYTVGDSITLTWYGAGFISNSSTDVCFSVPLSKSVVGSSTVTVESEDGLIICQNSSFTHGSASSTYVEPSSYTASLSSDGGMISVVASFADTTNAENNSPCGITASIKITFS